MAALVVLPEPCRPASNTTVGGFDAYVILSVSPPRMRISSSWTALMTCWPGSSACERVAPMACSRMRLQTERTTVTLTSASRSAVRISFITSSTSASVRRPLPRRRLTIPSSRLERLSNMRCRRLPAQPLPKSRQLPARSAPQRRRRSPRVLVALADRQDLGDDVVLDGDVDAGVGVVHRDRQIDTVLADDPDAEAVLLGELLELVQATGRRTAREPPDRAGAATSEVGGSTTTGSTGSAGTGSGCGSIGDGSTTIMNSSVTAGTVNALPFESVNV